jgi:Skp family chaperone for outer membrane proteins
MSEDIKTMNTYELARIFQVAANNQDWPFVEDIEGEFHQRDAELARLQAESEALRGTVHNQNVCLEAYRVESEALAKVKALMQKVYGCQDNIASAWQTLEEMFPESDDTFAPATDADGDEGSDHDG